MLVGCVKKINLRKTQVSKGDLDYFVHYFVMVTFRNNHSNLTDETQKEHLGSIAVGVSSHRKDDCLLLSGLGENWQSFEIPHFSVHT